MLGSGAKKRQSFVKYEFKTLKLKPNKVQYMKNNGSESNPLLQILSKYGQ